MTNVSVGKGYWGALLAALVTGLFLAGCKGPEFAPVPGLAGGSETGGSGTAGGSAVAGAPVSPNQPPEGLRSGDSIDRIHPGDMLRVEFSDLPMPVQPIEQRVRDDGTITLIQNQVFTAGGKTRGELADDIRKRYVPAFFVNMTVSVNFVGNTQFYYVGGEVKTPGRQVYLSRLTVLGAIKSAGDFTDFANRKKVQLTRADGRSFRIDCKKALRDPKLDLEVFPGDNINVPRRINPFSS